MINYDYCSNNCLLITSFCVIQLRIDSRLDKGDRTSVSVIVCTNQIYYNQGDFAPHHIIITYLVLGHFNCIVQLQLSSRGANTEYNISVIPLRIKYIQHIGHTIFETTTMLPFNILWLIFLPRRQSIYFGYTVSLLHNI